MLLSLVTFMLIQQLIGAPVPTYPPGTLSTVPALLYTRAEADICAQPDGRSVWDIVWGSLVTIFACTWIAVHPNIPGPTDSRWCIFKRGLSTMAYALIAPELMVTWALHQYLGARQIMRKYNKEVLKYNPPKRSPYQRFIKNVRRWFQEECDGSSVVKWTKTHGFFIQMGGFMLYKNGEPVEVLTYDRLKELIEGGEVDIPRIAERTINDKSKSDYLSKGFVVVQTTWFVVQCGARWVIGLPLVELEVVTLAFAVLNAITYALWLNKPQNVLEAIRIDLKPVEDAHDDDGKSETLTYVTAVSKFPTSIKSPVPSPQTPERCEQTRGWLHRHLIKDYQRLQGSWYGLLWFMIYRIPYRIVTSILHPMKKLFIYSNPRDTHSIRVPMFAHERLGEPSPALELYLPCLIGMFFGLVHVIAWTSGPTELERQVWRYSTLVITIEPLLFAIARGISSHKELDAGYCVLDILRYILLVVIWFPFIVGLPAYMIARVALFTEALASLRHLSPAAYCGIDWDSFIPHL